MNEFYIYFFEDICSVVPNPFVLVYIRCILYAKKQKFCILILLATNTRNISVDIK